MTGQETTDDLICTATAEGGRLRCAKPKYRARKGEAWEHAGGHFFVTDEGARLLATDAFDAKMLLSNLRRAVPDV